MFFILLQFNKIIFILFFLILKIWLLLLFVLFLIIYRLLFHLSIFLFRFIVFLLLFLFLHLMMVIRFTIIRENKIIIQNLFSTSAILLNITLIRRGCINIRIMLICLESICSIAIFLIFINDLLLLLL